MLSVDEAIASLLADAGIRVGTEEVDLLNATGRTLAAEEAERIGLLNRLVDGNALEAGIAYARELSCHSLPVLDLARSAVSRALDNPLSEGFRIEADLWTLAYQTEDAEEGMTAFLEKRAANFKDR